jgi:hypothetical protein
VLDFIGEGERSGRGKGNFYLNGIKSYLDGFSSAAFMREFVSKESNVLYVPFICQENIKKVTVPTFFHLCRLRNISFDL